MMLPVRRVLKYVGLGLVGLIVLVVAGFALGVLGAPTVENVENRFADVNNSTTTIDTDLTVDNPNPIGVSLGGLAVEYAIDMNDVEMATGQKEGVSIGSGTSTVPFRTHLANERIPEWWYTHVDSGETTEVVVDVDLSHSLLGGRSVSIAQEETIRTDILGQFNDSTTRPVDADAPGVSDPVLYVNETAAWYGEDVTREQTPLEMAFTVYNPKPYPYAVTEVGYVIEMNGIQVGEGGSERAYSIPPGGQRTIQATTVIDNQRLDEWWVSHLERDQVTNLSVDVYVVVNPDTAGVLGEQVPAFRIDTDEFVYETTIETDIFGTKASDGLPSESTDGSDDASGDGSSDDGSADGGDDDGGDETPTEESTATATATPTATEAPTATPTPTPTPTDDDGVLPV